MCSQKKTGVAQVSHIRRKCIGCGNCAYYAPHQWTLDSEDGLARFRDSRETKPGEFLGEITNPDDLACNNAAAENCPVKIIHIKKT